MMLMNSDLNSELMHDSLSTCGLMMDLLLQTPVTQNIEDGLISKVVAQLLVVYCVLFHLFIYHELYICPPESD